MWQLLNGQTEILLQRGYLYVPLLFDPEIAAELTAALGAEGSELTAASEVPQPGGQPAAEPGGPSPAPRLLFSHGHYYIKSLALASLVEHFQAVFPEEYEQARTTLLLEILPCLEDCPPVVDAKLQTILFEVFPYFFPSRRGGRRQSRSPAAVLTHLAESVVVPPEGNELLSRLRQREAGLKEILQWLAKRQAAFEGGAAPLGSGQELIAWCRQALQVQIVTDEIARRRRELSELQALWNLPENHLAILLTIAARGAVEINGMGVARDAKRPGEYWVYKNSGEFVLQDYFGRLYLFPSCRVGVASGGPFHPVVLDRYKHPLLRRFAPRQPICLTDYQAPQDFSATAVIQALQEGLEPLPGQGEGGKGFHQPLPGGGLDAVQRSGIVKAGEERGQDHRLLS